MLLFFFHVKKGPSSVGWLVSFDPFSIIFLLTHFLTLSPLNNSWIQPLSLSNRGENTDLFMSLGGVSWEWGMSLGERTGKAQLLAFSGWSTGGRGGLHGWFGSCPELHCRGVQSVESCPDLEFMLVPTAWTENRTGAEREPITNNRTSARIPWPDLGDCQNGSKAQGEEMISRS